MKGIPVVVCSLLAAGCQQLGVGPKYDADIKLSNEAVTVLSNGGALPIPLPATGMPSDAMIIFSAMAERTPPSDPKVQKALAIALISNSDAQCEHYMAESVLTSNYVNSGLGVGSLALTAAAGVTTPVESANLLSGVAAFLTGTRTELTNNVLGGKTPDILYRAVMAVRKEERQRLLTLLEAQPEATSYVLGQLNDYHSKCGIVVALNAITAAVETAENTATDDGQKDGAKEAKAVDAARAQ